MCATVQFDDDDPARAVERLRKPFVQRTRALGLLVDVSNVAAALEDLDGVESR